VAVDVTAAPGGDPARFLRNEPDEALVAHVLQGSEAAFEAIYDRHHRGLIAFCRHMLRSREEAEDALQHTFAAAYRSLTTGDRPNALKPWLYTIARNRCLTVLRARRTRDDAATSETADGAVVEGLSDAVQRRADLRDLVADLHRLPEDQRAALVLLELGDHSHAEIADVLSVNREKVKALVFQAREGLLRARTARDTPCAEIRNHLSSRTRALPRRGVIRGHLDCCPACAAYDLEVRRQRAALAIALPVVPSLELKASVLGPLLGSGATVAAGGAAGIGTVAAGTAATAGAGASAGAAGAGAVGGTAGAAGGALALGTGVGSGLTGGTAMTGLGALAANAVVAKVVTVVAVAGAAAGGGHAIGTMHHRSAPAKALSAPAVTAAAPEPTTIPAPAVTAAAPEPTTIPAPAPTVVPPAVKPAPAVTHPTPATTAAVAAADTATGSAATTAANTAPAGSATATPEPTAPQTGGTAAQDPAPGESAPATEPATPADGDASGLAPAASSDTSTPAADADPTVAADTVDPEPAPVGGASTAAPPVTCPPGTAPVDPSATPQPPAPPASTDPATTPPVPTVTLPDGATVPIPDGCALVPPPGTAPATAADPAVSLVALGAAAAASDAPATP
jgi:RNA polymerase sigma factor (sigma-70 family)